MSEFSVAQFIEIERLGQFWDAEIRGLHLWPALREEAMVSVRARRAGEHGRVKPAVSTVLKPALWPHHLRSAAFLLSPARPLYDSLFFHYSIDRIYKTYYPFAGRPLIAEASLFGGLDSANRAAGRDVFLQDTYKIWAAARGRLVRINALDRRTIADFARHAAEMFDVPDWTARWQNIIETFLRRDAAMRPLIARRIVPRIRSRIAFADTASYMAAKTPITLALHDAGFTVIEAQHGIVNEAHVVYTLPDEIVRDPNHPARRYLPDILTTFGQYWSDHIQTAARTEVIGFPHLTDKLDALERAEKPDPRQLLFASQWTVSEKMVMLALETARLLPDYHIVFKLHPFETRMPERFTALRGIANIEIVDTGDIHPMIARSGGIVGFNSTVLFEALAFTGKRIFALDNPVLPPEVGARFKTADELAALVRSPGAGLGAHDRDYFFASDPHLRARRLMTSLFGSGTEAH